MKKIFSSKYHKTAAGRLIGKSMLFDPLSPRIFKADFWRARGVNSSGISSWATGYNIVALPLAAGVLYKSGILLSPAAGAALMAINTVVIAINASLLKVK
jgi:hypothetical protein